MEQIGTTSTYRTKDSRGQTWHIEHIVRIVHIEQSADLEQIEQNEHIELVLRLSHKNKTDILNNLDILHELSKWNKMEYFERV